MAGGFGDLTGIVLGQQPSPGMSGFDGGGVPPADLQSESESELAQIPYRDMASASPGIELWRREAAKAWRYYDLDQWDSFDRMTMDQLKRPALVLDRIQAIVNAISGMEKINRKLARIVPTALDAQDPFELAGELATEALEADLKLVQGHEQRSLVALDDLVAGMGWYHLYPDYERFAEPGVIALEHFDGNDAYWDTGSRMTNLADSRWRCRGQTFGTSAFRERWGDKLDAVSTAGEYRSEMNIGRYELVTPYYSRANEEANPNVSELTQKRGELRVFQYQRRIKGKFWRYYDPRNPNQLAEVADDEWKFMIRRLAELGGEVPDAVPIFKPRIQQLMVCNGILLEPPLMLKTSDFTLRCITGKWHRSKKFYYGIVRGMIDGQDVRNKAISSAVGFHLNNARGGVMYESDAFEDAERAKEQWSSYDAWIELQPGGAPKVIQRQNTPIPPELAQFYQIGSQSEIESSGISEEVIGLATQEVGSPAQGKRIGAVLAGLGWFFDPVLADREGEARTMLELITEYWSNGYLLEVGGMAEEQSIPLLPQLLPLSYKVELDDSVRYSPDVRAQVWEDIKPFLPIFMRYGLAPVLLKFLKYSRIPAQLVQEITKLMQQQPQMGQKPPSGRGAGGGGKPPPSPEEQAANLSEKGARTQKLLAEARDVEQSKGLELARLLMEAQADKEDRAHKERLSQHRMIGDFVKLQHQAMRPKVIQQGGPPNGQRT